MLGPKEIKVVALIYDDSQRPPIIILESIDSNSRVGQDFEVAHSTSTFDSAIPGILIKSVVLHFFFKIGQEGNYLQSGGWQPFIM